MEKESKFRTGCPFSSAVDGATYLTCDVGVNRTIGNTCATNHTTLQLKPKHNNITC